MKKVIRRPAKFQPEWGREIRDAHPKIEFDRYPQFAKRTPDLTPRLVRVRQPAAE